MIGRGHDVDTQSMILQLSGQNAPSTVSIDSSTAWIRFTTDAWGQWLGFYIVINCTQNSGKYLYPQLSLIPELFIAIEILGSLAKFRCSACLGGPRRTGGVGSSGQNLRIKDNSMPTYHL